MSNDGRGARDLAIMAGNVLTMDPHNRRAEAVGVDGGAIVAVGG